MQLGDATAPTPSTGGFNTAYAGPGIPMRMAKPIAWFFFYSWMYLTAPVEAALYPIAGAAAESRNAAEMTIPSFETTAV